MRCVLSLFVAATLAFASADGAAAARRQEGKKGVRDHHFHGVVAKVHHSKKDRDDGTITVLGHEQEKGGKGGKKHEMKFHVNEKTVFEVIDVHGKGKDARRVTHKGSFRKVHEGDHVHVLHHGHHAVEVKVVHHHKGKNKR